MWYIYKICINCLLMLSVKLPISSRLLTVKFLGSQKLHVDFWLHGVLVTLSPEIFRGQLYSGNSSFVQSFRPSSLFGFKSVNVRARFLPQLPVLPWLKSCPELQFFPKSFSALSTNSLSPGCFLAPNNTFLWRHLLCQSPSSLCNLCKSPN